MKSFDSFDEFEEFMSHLSRMIAINDAEIEANTHAIMRELDWLESRVDENPGYASVEHMISSIEAM